MITHRNRPALVISSKFVVRAERTVRAAHQNIQRRLFGKEEYRSRSIIYISTIFAIILMAGQHFEVLP